MLMNYILSASAGGVLLNGVKSFKLLLQTHSMDDTVVIAKLHELSTEYSMYGFRNSDLS